QRHADGEGKQAKRQIAFHQLFPRLHQDCGICQLRLHWLGISSSRGGTGSSCQQSERGAVSRSIVMGKERVELVRKLEFQAPLLRVTDPRSASTPLLSKAAPFLPYPSTHPE